MDFVDMLLNRIDGELDLKKPTHALICFTRPETGKRLSNLASDMLSKAEKSSITLLYFIHNREEIIGDENVEVVQNRMLAEFMPKSDKNEKSKITIRLFINELKNYVTDIQQTTDETQTNLLLLGMGAGDINLLSAQRYGFLKSDPANVDNTILTQFGEEEAWMLKNISALLSRNKVPIGMFHDNGLTTVSHIFIPVLCKADVHIFTFVYQTAQKDNVQITVWDAVGIIESEPKMQKLYQFIVKKSDGRVHLWDDNKKIEKTFIEEQDLVIIGIDGWSKLISAPLSWKDSLPSMLIIKDTSN